MSITRSSTFAGRVARAGAQARSFRPGYRILIALTWAACGATAWWFTRAYLPRYPLQPIPAATPAGRWFGIAGFLLFLFLAFYGLRRTAYRSRLGALPWWYRAHLLLGLVALTLLACHSG